MSAFIKIVIFMLIFGYIGSKCTKNDTSPTPTAPAVTEKTFVKDNVQLQKIEFQRGGFENILMLSAKIENKSKRDIKDIKILCTHYANSGTVIDSNERIVYELVKAGSSKKIKEFNMGFIHSQANSTACEIVDFTLL